MDRHSMRRPNGGMRHMMYAWLVGTIRYILKDAKIPNMADVTWARGLRTVDASRHGNVVVLVFFVEGRHLVAGVVATTLYRNIVLQKIASVPCYATK